MPPTQIRRLLNEIGEGGPLEISMECNPEDVTATRLTDWKDAGLNRLSLGIQTLNKDFARLLNRACTASKSASILQLVAEAQLPTWSIDLMFALPNQSVDDLQKDLDGLLQAGVPHVSLYGLTWEPGTPFHNALVQGRLQSTPDQQWREQYDLIRDVLTRAGFEQYEVSNFAKAGHRSIHNQLYWSDYPYMGIGPSAHGYRPDGHRTCHVADIQDYLMGDVPHLEAPTPEQLATDMLIGGMRTIHGLDLKRLEQKTSLAPSQIAIQSLEEKGLIVTEDHRIRPTFEGFPISDAIVRHLVTHLHGIRTSPSP